MKKFFTVIPEEGIESHRYQAVGNSKLQMEESVHFPILTAISGYTESGEDVSIIAIAANERSRNLALFLQEVDELCKQKGVHREIHIVVVADGQEVAAHVATFRKLIDHVADDDELFVDTTYGSKALTQAIMMAVQYAYRIKRNTSYSCAVYAQGGFVYDETALLQMDEIVRVLAERGVDDPRGYIDRVLAL
jgi:hypothetical protein